MARHSAFRMATLFLAALFAPAAGGAVTFYTPSEPTTFDGSGAGVAVRGSVEPVTAEEMDAIDASDVLFAPPVPDSPTGAIACFAVFEARPCGTPDGDVFVYRVLLDADSDPVGSVETSTTIDLSLQSAGFVIDDDPATRTPVGTIFIAYGRGVVFDDPPTPPLGPGETTPILLTGWPPGSLATYFATTPSIRVGFRNTGGLFLVTVPVPEPSASVSIAFALLGVAALARAQRP